jgi:hypothetical protein
MFEYFYHEIIRKTVVSFGTLFNGISIKHKDDTGNVKSSIRVPLSYGPTQKFLARLEQVPNLNKPVQMNLPRMSFELIGMSYDTTRKLTTTQTFLTRDVNNNQIKKAYLPVPYNLNFELSIMTKLNDDMLQIVEQILPYFQPNYNLTVDLVQEIGEKRDIPIVLDNISMTDNYEGDYTERRALIYTLKFTAKTYLFGPVSSDSVSSEIIKKVSLGFAAGEASGVARREVVYSVEPRAIQNYTGTVTTTVAKDIEKSDTLIDVVNASGIISGSYIDINQEEFYVESVSGNTLTVRRGQDSTLILSHVSGSDVKLITAADDLLIEPGDDFGFSGSLD